MIARLIPPPFHLWPSKTFHQKVKPWAKWGKFPVVEEQSWKNGLSGNDDGGERGRSDRLGECIWQLSSCGSPPPGGKKQTKTKKHVGYALSHAGAPCLSVVNLQGLVNLDCVALQSPTSIIQRSLPLVPPVPPTQTARGGFPLITLHTGKKASTMSVCGDFEIRT